MKRISLIAQLSPLFVFLISTMVTGAFAYGEFDITYKPEGLVGTNCSVNDLQAVTADGSIYTLMRRAPTNGVGPTQNGIVRHRADGSIDKAWGTGGEVSAPSYVAQFLPAADGGLFVIGTQISRYRRDGTLDWSYGSLGTSDAIIPNGSNFARVALQSDGSIVAETYSSAGRVFIRTNPRGIRDTGFGLGGYFSIPFAIVPNDVNIYAWSIEADGSLQLAWQKKKPDIPLQFEFVVKRFRKDLSTADPSFDAGGRLVPRQGVADWLSPFVKVQADGALLLATYDCLTANCSEPVVAVRRYDASGNVDSAFGDGGKTIFRLLPGENDPRSFASATALWLGPDGKLTVHMHAQRQFGSFGISATGILAYRLNADGTFDLSFENGKQILNQQYGNFLQLDDGRLLHPGAAANGGCAPQRFLTDTPRTAAAIVEYYSPSLNHYFMTAHEFEKDFVERGLAGDWKPTGQVFGAFSIDAPMPATSPVCRFYGGANGGPNSHFYSAEKFECDILARIEAQTPPDKPAWRFEREAFRITEPVAGICPPNLTPLYRLYNRAGEPGRDRDPNHRYTTDLTIHADMQSQGWVSEGVHMCMPPASRSDRMPY